MGGGVVSDPPPCAAPPLTVWTQHVLPFLSGKDVSSIVKVMREEEAFKFSDSDRNVLADAAIKALESVEARYNAEKEGMIVSVSTVDLPPGLFQSLEFRQEWWNFFIFPEDNLFADQDARNKLRELALNVATVMFEWYKNNAGVSLSMLPRRRSRDNLKDTVDVGERRYLGMDMEVG